MSLAVPSIHGRKSIYTKPILGLAGGIGSGKSFVARAFQDLGCGLVDADADAHDVLRTPEVQSQLIQWWGPEILGRDGEVDRQAIAAHVFDRPEELAKLNAVIHPAVLALRDTTTARLVADPKIRAVMWDIPLLFELGLERQCDLIIFVNALFDKRLERISANRGWSAEELQKREKFQFSLDNKQNLADYVIDNSNQATATLGQVREIFSQILARQVASAQS